MVMKLQVITTRKNMHVSGIPRKLNKKLFLMGIVLIILIWREIISRGNCRCEQGFKLASGGSKQGVKVQVQDSQEKIHFRYTFDAVRPSSLPIGADNTTQSDKYFIYRCDEGSLHNCGGWADRINGAITAYMIANLTGRIFKMEIILKKCEITRFIVPNQVDWYLPNSFHPKVVDGKRGAKIIVKMDKKKTFLINVNEDYLTMPEMNWQYIYMKTNGDYTTRFQSSKRYRKQVSWMADLNSADINAALYRRLFKPSPYLLEQVSSFLSEKLQRNEKLVCAHIRMSRNPTIPDDSEVRMREEFLPNVWRILEKETKNVWSKIFLMSDSGNVIKMAKSLPFGNKFIFSPGDVILHIDKAKSASPNERCKGLEKVLFEQLVLMHCDTLVIGISGLSRMAAYMRGTDEGLYCLFDAGQVESCKRKQIAKLYQKYI